jgi:DNA-binding NtrC family response regulator
LSVLLIDDDEELGEVLQQVLATECDVTLLHDGRAAITKLVSPESTFDLVVCDLMMPDVSGMDVFEEATRARPDIANRFVFMTGGAFTPRSRAFVQSLRAPLLAKPFEMNVLRDLVATYRDATR